MMPNSDLKVLGEKVRKERKLAGLTQEQLAERCHVSTKHILGIPFCAKIVLHPVDVPGTNCNAFDPVGNGFENGFHSAVTVLS